MRAICMLQVMGFHAWQVGSPIGVDVFLMISAYLLAGSFIRRSESGTMPSLPDQWLRLFKRLLPPLVLAIWFAVTLTYMFLPRTRRPEILEQAIASLFYFQNWRLLGNQTDYYAAEHSLSSPLMHLWSMSMQGQVFLIWPLLMAACVLIARRLGKRIRVIAMAGFGTLAVASMIWLLVARATEYQGLYFDTRSRIWEFALGSMVAVVAPLVRVPDRWKAVIGWGGLGTIVLFSLVSIGTYPGPMATIPMLAAATVLTVGTADAPGGLARFLSLRPLVALGDISYALYLVHWPIIAVYLGAREQDQLSPAEGVVLIMVSIGTATLLTKWVDAPLRRLPWTNSSLWHKAAVVATSLAVGVAPIAFLEHRQDVRASESPVGDHPGARVFSAGELDDPARQFGVDTVPIPEARGESWAGLPDACDGAYAAIDRREKATCAQQLPDDGVYTSTVVAIGDSHMEQLLPAITPGYLADGARVVTLLLGGCQFRPPTDDQVETCVAWNQDVLATVAAEAPDTVLFYATAASADTPDVAVAGIEEYVRVLADAGVTRLIGVRDNPRFPFDMYECSLGVTTTNPVTGCMVSRSMIYSETMPDADLSEIEGYMSLDLSDVICTGNVCPGVIGGVNVYLDDNHLTREFSESMADITRERLRSTSI
ncbi:acyltransferase family protein [Brooklawnia cerclae]